MYYCFWFCTWIPFMLLCISVILSVYCSIVTQCMNVPVYWFTVFFFFFFFCWKLIPTSLNENASSVLLSYFSRKARHPHYYVKIFKSWQIFNSLNMEQVMLNMVWPVWCMSHGFSTPVTSWPHRCSPHG